MTVPNTLMLLLVFLLVVIPTSASAQGWYFLVPPIENHRTVQHQAPLAQWHQYGSYDTADACRTELAIWVAETRQMWERISKRANTPEPPYVQGRLDHARCISVADPRLAPEAKR